jgi:putative salt-induced outer membrane protein YdiY
MKYIGMRSSLTVGMFLLIMIPSAGASAEWERTIAIGINATEGNSETKALNGSIKAETSGDVHEARLGIDVNYGESTIDGEDETTTDNTKAVVVYKYKFNGSYIYNDNSILRDDIAAIDYRLITGLGGGYNVVKTETATLGLELGVAYIREELTDGTKDDVLAPRVAARHDQKIGEAGKCWLSAEYLPNIDDTADYLVNGEVGVEAALNNSMNLRIVVQGRYDSTVPEDREKEDISLVSSLVYKL